MPSNDDAREAFVRNLRALMKDRDCSQRELASRIGMSGQAISTWITKRAYPTTVTLQKLADALGVSVDQLVSSDSGYASGGKRASIIGQSFRPVRAAPDARVPIRRLGRVHAGETDEEYEDDGETLVPAFVAEAHPKCFSVRVVGGCMDNVIPEGYDAVLDPEMEPRDRCIAVVEIEPGEAVMRRWTVTSRTLVLSCDSHTEEHDDIVLKASDSPRVVGVVVWAQCDMLEWAV